MAPPGLPKGRAIFLGAEARPLAEARWGQLEQPNAFIRSREPASWGIPNSPALSQNILRQNGYGQYPGPNLGRPLKKALGLDSRAWVNEEPP